MYYEDCSLLLVAVAGEEPVWMSRWARSYPLVYHIACVADARAAIWADGIQSAFTQVDDAVCVVAYGAGTVAVAAWYARLSLREQKRVKAVILVSPPPVLWQTSAGDWGSLYFQCRTAWVVGAQETAALWAANAAAVT